MSQHGLRLFGTQKTGDWTRTEEMSRNVVRPHPVPTNARKPEQTCPGFLLSSRALQTRRLSQQIAETLRLLATFQAATQATLGRAL